MKTIWNYCCPDCQDRSRDTLKMIDEWMLGDPLEDLAMAIEGVVISCCDIHCQIVCAHLVGKLPELEATIIFFSIEDFEDEDVGSSSELFERYNPVWELEFNRFPYDINA